MTKDEALKFIIDNSYEDYENHSIVIPIEKATELKDLIFQEFETRICANCEYCINSYFGIQGYFCANDENNEIFCHGYTRVDPKFGCNRFKRRQK